jgi:hypothetical protein
MCPTAHIPRALLYLTHPVAQGRVIGEALSGWCLDMVFLVDLGLFHFLRPVWCHATLFTLAPEQDHIGKFINIAANEWCSAIYSTIYCWRAPTLS